MLITAPADVLRVSARPSVSNSFVEVLSCLLSPRFANSQAGVSTLIGVGVGWNTTSNGARQLGGGSSRAVARAIAPTFMRVSDSGECSNSIKPRNGRLVQQNPLVRGTSGGFPSGSVVTLSSGVEEGLLPIQLDRPTPRENYGFGRRGRCGLAPAAATRCGEAEQAEAQQAAAAARDRGIDERDGVTGLERVGDAEHQGVARLDPRGAERSATVRRRGPDAIPWRACNPGSALARGCPSISRPVSGPRPRSRNPRGPSRVVRG